MCPRETEGRQPLTTTNRIWTRLWTERHRCPSNRYRMNRNADGTPSPCRRSRPCKMRKPATGRGWQCFWRRSITAISVAARCSIDDSCWPLLIASEGTSSNHPVEPMYVFNYLLSYTQSLNRPTIMVKNTNKYRRKKAIYTPSKS